VLSPGTPARFFTKTTPIRGFGVALRPAGFQV